MERIWLVLRFWRATKERDLDLHICNLVEMCYTCFAYDLQNYARYATIYVMLLLIMDETHPELIIFFVYKDSVSADQRFLHPDFVMT